MLGNLEFVSSPWPSRTLLSCGIYTALGTSRVPENSTVLQTRAYRAAPGLLSTFLHLRPGWIPLRTVLSSLLYGARYCCTDS